LDCVVERELGKDPCEAFDVCTKLLPGWFVAFVATAAIFGANNRINSGVVDGKPGGIAIGNIYGSAGLYRNECAVSNGTWGWVCDGQFDDDGGSGNGGKDGGMPFVPPVVVPVFGSFGLELDDRDGWVPAKLIKIGSNWLRSKPGGGVRDGCCCCCCCCTTAINAASNNGGNDDDDDDGGGGDDDVDDDEGIWTKVHGDREFLLLLLKWTLIGLK
jgi:hypothetical protein